MEIRTVEMHTGGEPVRIVVGGYPEVRGETILKKREFARNFLDVYRKRLMFEPRGHYDMYGVIPVEPDLKDADLAVLFTHNEGYSTMCGHATIAIGRWAVDHGLVKNVTEPETAINLQCPCGLVKVFVEVNNGKSGAVRFHSVPAFCFALDVSLYVEKIGHINVDVAYGGAFYAFVHASQLGLDVHTSPISDIINAATWITQAAQASIKLSHPEDEALAYFYGTIVIDDADQQAEKDVASANVCIFAHRQTDRSPTGSGVTARMAINLARKKVSTGESNLFQSRTKDVFSGKIISSFPYGQFEGCVVEVRGRAYYTGTAVFTVEEQDPLKDGFLIE